jgi:hypothetical protein
VLSIVLEGFLSVRNKLRVRGAAVAVLGDAVLNLTFRGGVRVSFPLGRVESFRRRRAAREALRDRSEALFDVHVTDGGFTVEWPRLEVSFDVTEMLPEYLGIGMTARAAARKAGSATSPAKAAAAATNGAKGGRPRKKVAARNRRPAA